MARRPVTSARKPTRLTWTPCSQPCALYKAPSPEFWIPEEEDSNKAYRPGLCAVAVAHSVTHGGPPSTAQCSLPAARITTS